MANFTFTPNASKIKDKKTKKATPCNFISWSPYPQVMNKKTELVNRIGSYSTIIQDLFHSSSPSSATTVFFDATHATVVAAQEAITAAVGQEGTLVDNINSITYENVVIVDLATQIKKVQGGWLLICQFTQLVKKESEGK